jgi:hypothetical protein
MVKTEEHLCDLSQTTQYGNVTYLFNKKTVWYRCKTHKFGVLSRNK